VIQDKIYLVGTLGLLKHEIRFIKIMLGLTTHAQTGRTQGRYEWSEDLNKVNVVIASADDDEAMHQWHKLTNNKPSPTLLLVTTADQASSVKYHLSRPFGPAKVLMLLDKIVKEQQEGGGAEAEIFSGAGKSVQREISRTAQGAVPARHRALVVDDSPTVRKQLVLELGSFNIQVDTAETGELGLEMLGKNHYDIIFLDVVMPGADGYQVCKSIRRNQETKLTPVVMLTSKSSPFDKVRGSLAGCSTYLTKPVDYENFYQVLEEFLAQNNDAGPAKKGADGYK
jgi:two-component system, cell cycle response regulator